jgi:hypothetical protein
MVFLLPLLRTNVGYPALPGSISQYNCEIVPCRFKEKKWAGLWAGPGVNIWGCPLAWFQAQVKWGAHAKFRGDSFCRSGGRLPDIHTHKHTHIHVHTHFHLYVLDYLKVSFVKRWTFLIDKNKIEQFFTGFVIIIV